MDYLEEGLYHYKEIPDYMIFQIERDMVIETSDDTAVTSFTLTIEKPLELIDENENKVQEMQELTTVVPEDKEITENVGHVISWEGVVPHGDKVEIKVFYTIKSAHIIWDISVDDSGDLKDIPGELQNKYTQNDWLITDRGTEEPVPNPYNTSVGNEFYRIHPTDPDITALAERLMGTETNVIKIVKTFYDYLDEGNSDDMFSRSEGCAYPDQFQMDQSRQTWSGMPKPARATLEDWVGDCDDQSFLLLSLCRAVGIPARVEAGGLWDSMAGAWGGHGWAQVYIPVNDGEDAWVTIDVVNNLFLDRDPFRFADYQGTGKPGMLENYYTSWIYSTDGGSNVFISEQYMDLNHVAIAGETVVHV
jgi:transglutaminase-like putative cysteine protease